MAMNAATRVHFIIDRHRLNTGLVGDDETIMFHVIADLLEFCDAKAIDFDLVTEQAREHLLANATPTAARRSNKSVDQKTLHHRARLRTTRRF